MKKLLVGLVSMLLMLCIAGCSGGGDTTDDTTATDTTEESASPSEGDFGTCYVSIGDCSYTTDYDGNRVIIVNYEFTNNSDEATSFIVETMSTAYQDGVEIDSSYSMYDIDVVNNGEYDTESTMRNVQPGATTTVQEAYVLTNDTSDILVEVSPFLTGEEITITKTFSQQ